jgi:prepilin-type processing-associated H-X9-DG protein
MIAYLRSRAGLTLIQLVELIAIAGVVLAFLISLFSSYPDRVGPRLCLSNLKQLGMDMMMYAQDYDECYPSSGPDRSNAWVGQLLPYAKNTSVFRCPQDVNPERSLMSAAVAGSTTHFPVSYGPNRLFVNPSAYGGKRVVSLASVVRPADRYLLADCVTASGFDLDTIAYVRYANYDPSLRQNGWSLAQFTAAGRVAWPDEKMALVTRHALGSNVVLADGHVRSLRPSQIPNNDGPGGTQYRKLREMVVPWQPVTDDP